MDERSRRRPAPHDASALAEWIRERLREPSAEWRPLTPLARDLPTPTNVPGMHKAIAALLSRYPFLDSDWHGDFLQDFTARWLLRPESAETIARSALLGLTRGHVSTIEAGIAWKLRAELLSQASRAYKRLRREQQRHHDLHELVLRFRDVAYGLSVVEAHEETR